MGPTEHTARRGGGANVLRWCASTAVGEGVPGTDNVAVVVVVVGSAHAPLSDEGGRNEREVGQADAVGDTVHVIYCE